MPLYTHKNVCYFNWALITNLLHSDFRVEKVNGVHLQEMKVDFLTALAQFPPHEFMAMVDSVNLDRLCPLGTLIGTSGIFGMKRFVFQSN